MKDIMRNGDGEVKIWNWERRIRYVTGIKDVNDGEKTNDGYES